MKNFFRSIYEKPLGIKILIIGASFLVPFLLFWQYILSNTLEIKKDLEEKLEITNSKILYSKKLTNNLDEAIVEKTALENKLKTAIAELPDSKELPELLLQISNLAIETGLEIELFQPTGEELSDFYSKVPVNIHVKGTFHKILKFFERVGNLERIVNISAIKMYNPEIKENSMIINTECVATTFRFLSKEERELNKENDKNQKK